jgi:hypothetical protein
MTFGGATARPVAAKFVTWELARPRHKLLFVTWDLHWCPLAPIGVPWPPFGAPWPPFGAPAPPF